MKKIIVVSLLSALLLSGCTTMQEPINYLDTTDIQSSEIEIIPEASEPETETEESETTSEVETTTEVETVSEPSSDITSSEPIEDKPAPENSAPVKSETTVPSNKKEESKVITSTSESTPKDNSNNDPYYKYLDNPRDSWHKYMDGNIRRTKECIFEDVNARRAKKGLQPFVWDEILERETKLTVEESLETKSTQNGHHNKGHGTIMREVMCPRFPNGQDDVEDIMRSIEGCYIAADKVDNLSTLILDELGDNNEILYCSEPCYIGICIDSCVNEHFIDFSENERSINMTFFTIFLYYPL